MLTRLRTTAVVLAAALVSLGACSWGAQEPGLFSTPVPSVAPPPTNPAPAPTDPRIPVAGEALWTTADGTGVTVRFAVHAVRRTSDATVLDWSVTPLAGPGRPPGQAIPSDTDLGLGGSLVDEQDLVLVDVGTGRAHRPLVDVSPERFSRCLCTPLFAVLPQLRYGDTRVLQLAFPPLPAQISRVDVVLPNVADVPGVPVTPVGRAPVAGAPTDLARTAADGNPVSGAKLYAPKGRVRHLQTVVVNRVVASPGLTSVVWTLYSVDDQGTPGATAGPPVSGPLPADLDVATGVPASGPRLQVPGHPPLGVRWTTATSAGVPTHACLCSGLGSWSRGLAVAGGSAHLATQVGPLPRGTARVDVLFPGLDAFTDVRVTWVDDVAEQPLEAGPGATWTYDAVDPPRGWSTQDWPTPLPAPAQVAGYSSRPERVLAALPGS